MLQIIRKKYHNNYTLGEINQEDIHLFTLELPYKNNERNISCIPEGIYNINIFKHCRLGECIFVSDVKDRSGILIHSGNSVQNFTEVVNKQNMHWTKQSKGCLLIGKRYRELKDSNLQEQCLIYDSKSSLSILIDYLKTKKITQIQILS